MDQIVISGIRMDLIRKDIRNIHLAVYPPNGRVRIAAPIRTNVNTVKAYVVSKLGWIKKNIRAYKDQERQTSREYIYRESHYFQGYKCLLNIIENDAPPKVVFRNKKNIDLYIKPFTPISKRQKVMNKWYREEIKKLIPEIVENWEKRIGITINEWRVKSMKTKWGSCNIHERRIWINLELAKKPVYLLEYIIVHEMVHLLERKHNEIFLSYMNQYMPDWEKRKKELNKLPLGHAEWSY